MQTLTQKLLTYGTGRTMEWNDMPTIRGIVRESAKDNYRFQTLLMGIIRSPQFMQRRVPADKPLPESRQAAVLN